MPKFVIPNALPLEEIESACPDRGPHPAAHMILFVGRLDEEKNLWNLLAALREVVTKRDAVALLCGTGPLQEDVRRWIDDSGLASRIRLLGFSDRVWNLMKGADALVAVSWYEGHPNAVIEAAACGCPLVLSDIRAHRDCFDDSSAAYAPAAEPQMIARRILDTLDHPASSQARASRAREVARQWSVARCTAEHLDVYDGLKSGRWSRGWTETS
jgi:glycosyltransferase involved in cell wall biosynthesis